MIELNLLPKELRSEKKRNVPEIPVLPVTSALLILVMLLHVSMLVATKFRHGALGRAEAKWEVIKPKKLSAEKLSGEIDSLERRLKVTRDIATPPIVWAELLSGLNLAVIPNIWLEEFKPVAGKTKGKGGRKGLGTLSRLELTGHALGKETATSTVGKFINSLKKEQLFSKYFEDIELEKMRHQKFEGEEVMTFKLICAFKAQETTDKETKPAAKKKR